MNSIRKINSTDRKIWLKAIDNALNGKLRQALIIYEKLLRKYPSFSDLNYEASLLYIKEGKYFEAYSCMEKIFEEFQNNLNYLNDFSVVCTKLSYLEKAEYLSKRAFDKEPNNSNHLINLGAIYNLMQNYEKAMQVIDHAIQINPLEPQYYNLMGVTLVRSGLNVVAKKMFEVAVVLDDNYIDAIVNLGILESQSGNSLKSIEILEGAIYRINKNNIVTTSLNNIKYLLSYDYLSVGRLQEGWLNYDLGFDLSIQSNSRRNPVRTFKKPIWNGEIIQGKTILIWREQGIGDEILFYTCLPDLVDSGMKVIVECEERLVKILSRSFPKFLIRKENLNQINLKNSNNEDYDYHLPVGSLMQYFRNDIKKFNNSNPIFKIDEIKAKDHENNLIIKNSFKKRIGICWRSGLLDMERNQHYLVIEDLIPILQNENFDFINLQYGDCEDELLKVEKLSGVNIIRWHDLDLKNDIDSVLALISRLDLVITVGTAVSPLAASLGKKVFLIGFKGWTNLGTNYYPFFPTIECFFPSKESMVSECIPNIQNRLQKFF
jgi:tetratricopeptide (TPR) repeat protein